MHGIGRSIAFQLAVVERLGRVMAVRRSHRSIFSLKSWLFTSATKADRFGRAGAHPLAGHYLSEQAFRGGTFPKLGKVLPRGAQLNMEHLFVQSDAAVVALHSLATAKTGMRFDNRYCWVAYFQRNLIVRVRAYLDFALFARLFEENPISGDAAEAALDAVGSK
jgi:ketosteroid isomerase-like protein